MSLKYWIGKASAVAQVGTVQITAVDGTPANNTFTLTVGDQTVNAVGDTDANTTATALAAAWNASTHAYFTGVTAGAATDTVTLTADTAGVPFVAVASVSGGGTGTIGAYSETTASAGPNDWTSADNWSAAAVPADNDDVVLRDSSVSIAYGLDQSAVELDSLTSEKTYTGLLGLDYAAFATSADGATTVDTDVEYRPTLLRIDTPILNIRRHNTTGTPAGSGRFRIDLGAVACEAVIEDTALQSADSGRSAVQINANSASTNIYIEKALGGVGIGTALPGTTSTVGNVSVSATVPGTVVLIGAGTTLTNYTQSGGTNTLQAAATVTSVTVNGGELATDGDFLITTLTVNSGKCFPNNIPAAGSALTTLNHNGGIIDSTRSSQPRTWDTVNMGTNSPSLVGNSNVVTITTLNEPSGPFILTTSE